MRGRGTFPSSLFLLKLLSGAYSELFRFRSGVNRRCEKLLKMQTISVDCNSMVLFQKIKAQKLFYTGLFLTIFFFYGQSLLFLLFKPNTALLQTSNIHAWPIVATTCITVLVCFLIVASFERIWLKIILGVIFFFILTYRTLTPDVGLAVFAYIYLGILNLLFFVFIVILEQFRHRKTSQVILIIILCILAAHRGVSAFSIVQSNNSSQLMIDATQQTESGSLTFEQRISKCKEIPPDQFGTFKRDKCLELVAKKEAIDKKDPSICNLIPDQVSRYQWCYFQIELRQKERTSFCMTLTDSDDTYQWAQSDCLHRAAISAKDIKGCELISPSHREYCYVDFAETLHDTSMCDKVVKDQLFKERCERAQNR